MTPKERGKLISIAKKGMKYKKHKLNPTSFKKGQTPWNKGAKGIMIAWNKGKSNIYTELQKKQISQTLKNKYKSGEIIHPLLGKNHSIETKEKIRQTKNERYKNDTSLIDRLRAANLGKKISKETREKISIAHRKEKHWNWKGGISIEPYDLYWTKEFRKKIRKRDNQVCMLCGVHREKLKRALHVHHINYNKQLSIQENCISLCMSCHMKTNQNRKHWTTFFQSILSEKYGYNYSDNCEVIIDLNKQQS